MKSRLIACLEMLALSVTAQQWRIALPDYHYEFPRDHFNHDDYRTEWWYYTGNLRAGDGHRFGYELTFFRQGVHLEHTADIPQTWWPDQIYLAHFALSDLEDSDFFHAKRLNRSGPGLAGASGKVGHYWNGNW